MPDLHVTKVADAPSVNAGLSIGYTVTVTNQQNASLTTGAAENVTTSDPLPSGPGVSWTISPAYAGPGSCSVSGSPQVLNCSLGKLDAGDVQGPQAPAVRNRAVRRGPTARPFRRS